MNWVVLVPAVLVLAIAALMALQNIREWGVRKFFSGLADLIMQAMALVALIGISALYIALAIAILAAIVVGIGYLLRVGWRIAS